MKGMHCVAVSFAIAMGVLAAQAEPLPGSPTAVTQLVYSLESGLDVVNVPLTPDIVAVFNATASKHGLSGAAWIAMTVERAAAIRA